MTTPDPDAVHALAVCISIQRCLFRDTVEDVAERQKLTVAELLEALAWFSRAEPRYRGTAEAEAAEAAATALRHPLIQPATERFDGP